MGCGGSKSAADSKETKKNAGAASNAAADPKDEKKESKAANKEFQGAMKFLGQVPLLKRLPADQLPLVSTAMELEEFSKGHVVIKQGDLGKDFFVIKSGDAVVTVTNPEDGPKEVGKLKAGDYFGEAALLRDEPRAATITVTSEKMTCFKMSGEKFREQGLHEKLQFANRAAIGVGKAQINTAKIPAPTEKNPADSAVITQGLKDNTALSGVVSLDDARIATLVNIAWKEEKEAGLVVVEEGDPNADYFYIVDKGKFEVSIAETAQSAEVTDGRQILTTIEKGGSFGELAMLYLTPRAATVKAVEKSTVWVIDRTNFKNTLMQVSDKKVKEYMALLTKVSSMAALTEFDREKVAKAMVEMHFSKDEIILVQGELGSTFYILYEGTVGIIKDDKEVSKITANKSQPQFFGEKALQGGQDEKRAATVKVQSETAKALALDRTTYEAIFKPLEDIMKAEADKHQQADPSRVRIQRKDLTRVGLLGCGGFGAVELWEHKHSKETYAMKALSKGYIVKTGMQESVMNEKNILNMTNSPFIIRLYETFNGQQSLYFLLEPALGGELYATYNRKGLHGSDKHARFYVAGVVFSFEHCHERHIIYRDLKPENLLLTDTGKIMLTDMGLAKFVIGKTFTTCGTPDYFAPEIIASTGHTNAVDWWMLGILLFELMSGRPPFESAYPMQTYSKVMKGIGKVNFPPKCLGPVETLIKGLLKREPAERLPMRPNGTKNIKDSKWYADFNWAAMKELTMEPPYKPTVKSKKDIANFSARKEDMPKQLEYKDDGTGWDKDFASKD